MAALLFLWIAWLAVQTAAPQFDVAVRTAVHSISSPFLTAIMRLFTWMGSGWFLWPCGAAIVWRLVAANRRRDAAVFVASVLGANIVDEMLKLIFRRTRPEAYFGEFQPLTYSFPSGHSFVSFCFCFTLA